MRATTLREGEPGSACNRWPAPFRADVTITYTGQTSVAITVISDFGGLMPDEVFYVRYMDDFLLLTRSRWQLRRGIARLARYFELSGFERHPDKTQTGRLYEQARRRGATHEEASARVQAYQERWTRWAEGQLQACAARPPDPTQPTTISDNVQ